MAKCPVGRLTKALGHVSPESWYQDPGAYAPQVYPAPGATWHKAVLSLAPCPQDAAARVLGGTP